MGTIWVKEFVGGLDKRRLDETASGGTLIEAVNVHVTSGGELEKRAAFVSAYTLPAGTIGLASGDTLYVFGHQTTPSGMPSGVTYQRLQHPDGTTALSKILSHDTYAKKVYVVAEFADGDVYHYYDGTLVSGWYDGKARAAFDITGGTETSSVKATGSFEILAGTGDSGGGPSATNLVTSILIDGVEILSTDVGHTGNNATTAAAVAAQITSYSSSPEYTATSTGQTVRITASLAGDAANGKLIQVFTAGDVTAGNVVNMAGGSVATSSSLDSILVDGVSILPAPVAWDGTVEGTAQDVVDEINGATTSPSYSASRTGATVIIIADLEGPEANGRVVSVSVSGGLTISPSTGITMDNGLGAYGSGYAPGSYVRTIGKKMYSTAGPVLHFSGIADPSQWTTDAVGAGFIDFSTESSGVSDLVAAIRYQNYVAAFSDRAVIIEAVDPDPALNRHVQTLENTGAVAAGSVSGFGDNDVFYLDVSGIRSLRARDSSNAAVTTDIGVPVDKVVVEKFNSMTDAQKAKITGLVEPRDGRFWLCMEDVIYVFSYFSGVKVSAWTTYTPTVIIAGVETAFTIDAALVHNRKTYVRSGNTIYVYGGTGATRTYDATTAEVALPYLDANDPSRGKRWQSIDVALRGVWKAYVAYTPENLATREQVAVLSSTTYTQARIPVEGRSTHISTQFSTNDAAASILSAVIIHYESDKDGDTPGHG